MSRALKAGAAAGLALLALTPSVASAHLVVSGMGPIYDGVSHFGLSPEDYLPAIGLGLYAGLQGPATARAALAAVTLGWLGGGALALAGVHPPMLALSVLTAVLYLAVGGLLAINVAWPRAVGAGVALALGLARGMADLLGVPGGMAPALSLIGMAVAVFAVLALAAGLTLPMRRLWMIVAARVGGSWLAALGLLFAGWLLRYGAQVQ
jgi:hypothetical protein